MSPIKLTAGQKRQLRWLLTGVREEDPGAAPGLSALLRALLRGERLPGSERLSELADALVDWEDQVRRGDAEPAAGSAEVIPEDVDGMDAGELRRRLTTPRLLMAHVDACSKGNPGPSGAGFVFLDEKGAVLAAGAKALGVATNNEAEYGALIVALEIAVANGVRRLHVRTDSRLMARQLTGEFAVRSHTILPLIKRAVELRKRLDHFVIEDIPREKNALADRLSNIGVGKG